MATTFQNDTLMDGSRILEVHLQAYGDTDQTGVSVIDISTLVGPDLGIAPGKLTLMEISWAVQGFNYVQLLWDATTDDEIITMSGVGYMSFWPVGGKHDPQTTGTTGDVLVSTIGAGADSSYNIRAYFKKKQ